MRTIRTTFISLLAVALLAGSAVGVSAQDEEASTGDPAGSSYFTGTLNPEGEPVDGIFEGDTIETSDPRVSGALSRAVNWAEPTPGLYVEAEAWRLENEDGSWTGQGTGLVHSGQDVMPNSFAIVELSGEGGYEGLTAVMLVDRLKNPYVIEGAVIAGEPVAFPEPPA